MPRRRLLFLKMIYKIVLEDEGYSIIVAGDSGNIIELINKHSPSLIITDIVMPNHSGIEGILKIIGENKVPILAISAFEDMLRSVKYLVAGSLIKPIDDDVLVSSVQRVLKK